MRIFSRSVRLRTFWLALLLLGGSGFPVSGEEACPPLENANAVLDCVRLRHPELQRSEAEAGLKSAAILSARQRPNPEIESRVLFGVGSHPSDVLSETNLYHPFELGGKRGARIRKATTESEMAQSNTAVETDAVVLETVLRLHRLRQIAVEKKMLREVLATYRKTVALYRSRPLLSPEQQTSLWVFDSALQEGELKKTELEDEFSKLQSDLLNSLDEEAGFSGKWLPSASPSWPEIRVANLQWTKWAPLQRARAQMTDAQAASKLAKSEAWPTLRFGPSLETDSPLGGPQTAVGFAFSTSLPFYDRNQGKKAEAQKQESKAELDLKLLERKAEGEARRLVGEYQRNLQAYRSSRRSFNFSKGHEEIEARFERGLIPSTLLLEAHRQMLELTEQMHRTELRAIESLWRIYALEGRSREEKI